ncbi:MAG TPA: IclR family transcriptional regulator C-terminal domain-containing protein, partial [Marivita sp.]|nr:IclR family transcriptional regulator C-terminal domain-containing protein [Marivita sp.]
IKAFVTRTGFHPLTARSHRNLRTAMKDIAGIRQRGYALDDEEHVTGLRCLAAVVWSPQGEAACAISVSGLAARLQNDKLDRIGQVVARAAAELTEKLGGMPPSGHGVLTGTT